MGSAAVLTAIWSCLGLKGETSSRSQVRREKPSSGVPRLLAFGRTFRLAGLPSTGITPALTKATAATAVPEGGHAA